MSSQQSQNSGSNVEIRLFLAPDVPVPATEEKVDETKRTRKRLTIAEKIEVARKLHENITVAAVAKEYGCSVRTAKEIKKNAGKYFKAADSSAVPLDAKSVRTPRFLQIETKIMQAGNQTESTKRVPLPRSGKIARLFYELETLATSSEFTDALEKLRVAEKAFKSAERAHRNIQKKRHQGQ